MFEAAGSFTPSPRRQRQVSATPWRSPLQGSPDRAPWDVSKIPRILADALAPKATIDARLRASNTLRRCTDSADRRGRDALREEPVLLASLWAMANADAGGGSASSISAARVRTHCTLALVNLLGEDDAFNDIAVHSEELHSLLLACLSDDRTICVSAGSQLLRRVSESDQHGHLVVIVDEWFAALCNLLEKVDDDAVTPHALSAAINVAGNARANFVMARSTRLLHSVVDMMFQCAEHPHRALQASKCCANLLAFGGNAHEVRRLAPSLVNAALECAEHAEARVEGGSGGGSDFEDVSALFQELREVARLVLEELHSADIVTVHAQVLSELASGRGVATRVRPQSAVLGSAARNDGGESPTGGDARCAHRSAADALRDRFDAAWVGAIPSALDAAAAAAPPNQH